MEERRYCKCGHREDQHLPDSVGRQGSSEVWATQIAYKGQCAVCDPSGSGACFKFKLNNKLTEKWKAFAEIRKINNKIYSVKLTFNELDQTISWLSNVTTEDDIENSILERVLVALEESKQTGVSV